MKVNRTGGEWVVTGLAGFCVDYHMDMKRSEGDHCLQIGLFSFCGDEEAKVARLCRVVDMHANRARWLTREEAVYYFHPDLDPEGEDGGMPQVDHIDNKYMKFYVVGTTEPGETFKDMLMDCHLHSGCLGIDAPNAFLASPDSPEGGSGETAEPQIDLVGAAIAAVGTEDFEEEEEE
jgi:hypothetical protein